MQSHNPVLSRNEGFASSGRYATFDAATPAAQDLERMYGAPPATPRDTGRMTLDDVVVRTGMMFGVLLMGAALGWYVPVLALPAALVGLGLGIWGALKREPSPPLFLTYAGVQGVFVGGISVLFQSAWSGIVQQAVLATLSVFVVALAAYKTGLVKVTPRFTKMVVFATLGYAVFALVNFGFAMFGFGDGWGFRTGLVGVLIGLFAVGLAAFNLVLDFDFAEKGVANGLPEKFAWTAAFGLIVTLVWLYIEMLRLIAILRGDN